MREPPELKPKSTTLETDVEPGDAPFAIDSPRAVVSKAETHGDSSPAVINVEKLGPWLIIVTFTLGATLCALVMILYFGPTYVDAMIEKSVAQAETRIRIDVAKDTADAKAVAHTAETHARVALDKVETAETELGKKGINIRTDGH